MKQGMKAFWYMEIKQNEIRQHEIGKQKLEILSNFDDYRYFLN